MHALKRYSYHLLLAATALCTLFIFMGLRASRDCSTGSLLSKEQRQKALDVLTPPTSFTQWDYDAAAAPGTPNTTIILTPMKNSAKHLKSYFKNLAAFDFPKSQMSLGFLVGESTDNTYEHLLAYLYPIRHLYRQVTVLRKDFPGDPNVKRTGAARHAFEAQVPRRKLMAKSRNYLLTALRDEKWVVWWDVDVIEFPSNIIQRMAEPNKDVMVANCYCHLPDGGEMPYDQNAWHETPQSRDWMANRDPDEVFLEGYYDKMWTRRMPLHAYKDYLNFPLVELDGVGATFLLVRGDVHRAGVNFPAFAVDHQVETEGFAKMAKKSGFKVWGMPQLLVYHPC